MRDGDRLEHAHGTGAAACLRVPRLVAFAACALAMTGCTATSASPDGGTSTDSGGGTGGDDATTGDDGAAVGTQDSSTVGAGDGSTMGTGDSSTSADGSSPSSQDAGVIDGSTHAYDGGLGMSCLSGLYGIYVQRTDGVLLREGPPEEPVLNSTTALPLAGIVSVQDGAYHGCAAVSDGSAQCWQNTANQGNGYGQLGNGTTTASGVIFRSTPVLTAANTPLTKVVSVASGESNTGCAVTSENKLWCWGDLTWIVNKGTTLDTGYAQAITTDGATSFTGVTQAAVGYAQACALVSGSPNTVWCWGYNGDDELAQGDTTVRQYPTKVLGLTNPTKIVVTPYGGGSNAATACALDGTSVRCWGYNAYGAAGVNSATNPITAPALVQTQSGSALDQVQDLAGGFVNTATLRTDGTLWRWGNGIATYATNYGVTNIVAIGWAGSSNTNMRYLTSDGIYHNAMTNVAINCGALQ